MSATYPHRITLQIGDISGDGHNHIDTVEIVSSVTPRILMKAYENGVKKCHVDMIKDLCVDYEDGSIPKDYADKLREAGVDIGDIDIEWVGLESWVDLFLRICKLGNQKIKVKVALKPNVIDIGGYGLFST